MRVIIIIIMVPKVKKIEMRRKLCTRNSFGNQVFSRQAMALLPIKFSYGGYYPFGKSFARNTFRNLVDNLLSMILIFDVSGRRNRIKS